MLIKKIADFIWDGWLVYLILFTGVYYTYLIKGLQFRNFFKVTKKIIADKRKREKGSVSPFQVFMTALGSCIGNGNIVGVATAVISGGPGALFWMWIAAFLGMAVKYGEIYLGVLFREKNADGEYNGGPMYYISEGLKLKPLGISYALLLLVQNSGGTLIQGNIIKDVLHDFFGIGALATSIILVFLLAVITFGGFSRLAKVTGKLVPFMTTFYLLAGLLILIFNFSKIGEVFKLIFVSAISPTSVAGGVIGYTVKDSMRFGIARGIYSNEAGEGTSAIFYSKPPQVTPESQAIYGILDVFIDSIVICTFSGLIVLVGDNFSADMKPVEALMNSFGGIHGSFRYLLGITMLLFGFSSMLGQWVLGKESFKYLIKNKFGIVYDLFFLAVVFIAPHFKSVTTWYIQDICLGILILPNLLALNLLGKKIKT